MLKSTYETTGGLILVVGPSGAGKDSIMSGAADELAGVDEVKFARRYITRAAHAGDEAHIPLTSHSFEDLAGRGFFCLHWRAHDLNYGIARTVLDDIAAGRQVIANVSRTVIDEARSLCRNVHVINVTAPAAVLAARLAGRGRETLEDIERRLSREVTVAGPDVYQLINDRSLAEGIDQFLRLVDRAAVED